MGVELIHANGQTDMKLSVSCRNLANAPKNQELSCNNYVLITIYYWHNAVRGISECKALNANIALLPVTTASSQMMAVQSHLK